MEVNAQGECLCGSVSFNAQTPHKEFHGCHCGMCRKWGGGPFLSVDTSAIQFKGEENIGIYNSSEWAERGFCKNCGTHLFYRFKGAASCFVSLGVLKDTQDFVFQSQIYVDKRPSYYCFANKTEELTEAQVIEKFGSV